MDENTQTYTINIGSLTVGDDTFEHRCLSASFGGEGVQTDTIPWADTDNNPWDYRAEYDTVIVTETSVDDEGNEVQTEVEKTVYNGTFVLEPIEMPAVEEVPTQLDRIEAQVTYTAMMTDTILMEEGDADEG